MPSPGALLRHNSNYRNTWLAQVVSEIGDYFNNVAVFALVMEQSGSGMVVSGVMLARAIPAAIAGPIAGVLLDRLDRKRIMIISDLVRAVIALGFVFTIHQSRPWLLYALSAVLMFASPFFTAGRAAILPTIATAGELHSANSLTQTTQWATLTAGTLLGGLSAARLGYEWAFIINSLSFAFSAIAIGRIAVPGGFRATRRPAHTESVTKKFGTAGQSLAGALAQAEPPGPPSLADARTQAEPPGPPSLADARTQAEPPGPPPLADAHAQAEPPAPPDARAQAEPPAPPSHDALAGKGVLPHKSILTPGRKTGWHEYVDGLAYMRSVPLMVGIAVISLGWAMGGGAAQVLFALFGEKIFHRGAAGIGYLWGFAGIGLLAGGAIGHWIGQRASFERYKRAVTASYVLHGAAYMLFSQVESFAAALGWMMLSRVGMAVTSVLNNSQLLTHTPDEFRGRVFSTMESLRWSVMIVSMAAAGIASQYCSPRTIGLVAGAFGALTALVWAWMDGTGRLPEPPIQAAAIDPVLARR